MELEELKREIEELPDTAVLSEEGQYQGGDAEVPPTEEESTVTVPQQYQPPKSEAETPPKAPTSVHTPTSSTKVEESGSEELRPSAILEDARKRLRELEETYRTARSIIDTFRDLAPEDRVLLLSLIHI